MISDLGFTPNHKRSKNDGNGRNNDGGASDESDDADLFNEEPEQLK